MPLPDQPLTVRTRFITGLLAASLCLASCDYRLTSYEDVSGDITLSQRQLLEPAATADEWMARVELDLQKSWSFEYLLTNLYAELPAIDQWDAIRTSLDALAKDRRRLNGLLEQYHGSDSTEQIGNKLLLFSAMLGDDAKDHEPALRKIIADSNIADHHSEETLTALLLLSQNRSETLTWIKQNKPSLIKRDKKSYAHSEDAKPKWKIALAENRIDEGIALLKDAALNESEADEQAELYQQLVQIGIVLERMPLAQEGGAGLRATLSEELKTEDPDVMGYDYQAIFDLPALDKDWQGIVDLYSEISPAVRSSESFLPLYQFTYMDKARATYLTALFQLGKADEFIAAVKESRQDAAEDSDHFFRMLSYNAPGQAPVGVLYVDALKKAGQDKQALDHLLHLLARSRGTDAFYKKLIELDPIRATNFIQSLHAYDPYEERPLIWLAEIARREKDLELAQKTIDEAIALDPSDGDHGKDTRMFCYEVLARIHEDSGRQGKADFFRSVVDSIRQGEAADDFLAAGLIKEATDRYRTALGQFEDAYCLQSRLAMTLAKNGRFEDALVHFKKAFSLMPVSFGPRESHCFGCEGIFNDPRVREIAVPLLEAFEKENPTNPRTPYLLGLIFSQKKEHAQAEIAFERALKLDPHYYNAATKLLSLLEKDPNKFTAAEDLKSRIFEFAPYPEKADYLPKQSELRAHWQLCEQFPPSPLDLPALSTPSEDAAKNLKKEQYAVDTESSYSPTLRTDKNAALDGWSASELRRSNSFLQAIDDLE